MFCKGCGAEVADGTATCPNCGAVLKEADVSQSGNVVYSPYPGIIGNVTPDYVMTRGVWALICVPFLIPALILGTKAINGAKTYDGFGNPSSPKVAIGKTLGIIARILCVLPFIAIIAFILIMAISTMFS